MSEIFTSTLFALIQTAFLLTCEEILLSLEHFQHILVIFLHFIHKFHRVAID